LYFVNKIVEWIHVKVKGKSLLECDSLIEVAERAHDVVHKHCCHQFYDSWESIAHASVNPITEEAFFRNYLWCVYVSGFSAKAVTANYDRLLYAHNLVDSRGSFVPSHVAEPPCKDKVFSIWKNHAKFKAIQETRKAVGKNWFGFRQTYLDKRDPKTIQSIAFMGPALSRHLARNLGGVQIVKPDVHMLRLSAKFVTENSEEWWEIGLDPVEILCKRVSEASQKLKDWPLGKVDLLLWYASATLRS
jgi:hypothetical protein